MTVDVLTHAIIRRPREIVAEFAGNPTNAPRWYANISSVEWKTELPVAVGAQVAFVAHFLRRELRYTYEIVEFIPSERMVMRTAQGPFPMETSYRWESTPAGHTRMMLRNRGNPSGFSRIAAPFMKRAMRRANTKDLLALKKLLES
jgi:hypothetical protein